jgi:hypothetical protein
VNVLIIETKTNSLAATIPISMGALDYTPSEQEYFAEAWRCAVDDKTVDPTCRDEYSFRLEHSA